MKIKRIIFYSTIFMLSVSCARENESIRYALKVAGSNKKELIKVLDYYKTIDPNSEKLDAARFLIENMPAHYSYKNDSIKKYYELALEVFNSNLSINEQRDSLKNVSFNRYRKSTQGIINDCKIISSEYLILSIDHAYNQWKTRPWSKQLSFDDFCEWLLPYKEVEKQEFDNWRGLFSSLFSDSISKYTYEDEKEKTIYHTIDIVRNEINSKIVPHIYWGSVSGINFLNAKTMTSMTFGSCKDYVILGVLGFRSLGLPAVLDEVPEWGRNCNGHSWFVFIDDRGREQATVNSLILPAGIQFYPYERIPKVWRSSYAINWDVVEYNSKSKYKYPFSTTNKDVTSKYVRTKDLIIPINRTLYHGTKVHLKEKYAYIAKFNGQHSDWSVLDFGKIKHGKAYFKNMGINNMYIILGYDGKALRPISHPFILGKDGLIKYIAGSPNETADIYLRRKYYESYNDVIQRNKIIGGKIQYSDTEDFNDCHTVLTIDSVHIPDKIPLMIDDPHRYWRYLAADGTNGSIAELTFFDKDTMIMEGSPICSSGDRDAAKNAFDDNWLTNYETSWDKPNDAWVGLSFQDKVVPKFVRVIPRGDGNDIIPGDVYELKCYLDGEWKSMGITQAKDNYLYYQNVPNTLLWLSDLTRGQEERPFLIDEDNNIEWW